MHARGRLVSLIFLTVFILLIGRLFWWQIIKGPDLSVQARSQYQDRKYIQATRGNILACDGTWLAASGRLWRLYIDKSIAEETYTSIANILAPLFIDEDSEKNELLNETLRIQELLNKDELVWVPIISYIDDSMKQEIEAMQIKGTVFEKQESRVYPEASSSAHLLGFVGKNEAGEDQGYFGLEGYYNLPLSGRAGFLERESDARGIPILVGASREIKALGGVNLLTHINKSVQLIAETKLKDGIQKYGAQSGSVVILEPSTGAVLAMSAEPSYAPDFFYDYSTELFKNPVIQDTFEPGSVFKPLVMASALDSGAIEPDTKCDICDGPVKVDKYWIDTWDQTYRPNSTMTDIIIHSDNVGMVYTAQQLGAEKLYGYLTEFGIGEYTDIDLQGESNSALKEKNQWNIVDLATISFGQGIAVTPIQLVSAIGAIANDGILMTPQVVDKIKTSGWEQDIEPVQKGRVISKKAADEATEMMVKAAKDGEAKWTAIRGFDIAGKTGTAQIPVHGHYDEEKTIASFVGFAPASDPKFIMLVTLREPESSPWASETAAPLWFSIAKDLFPIFKVQPQS